MWEMPLWMLLLVIVVLSMVVFFLLRPLRLMSKREWIISHCFIIIGLFLVGGWLWFNRGDNWNTSMLLGGIWTVFGGICFTTTHILRRFKQKDN